MIRRISLAVISVCIAACASSGPETPASAGADAVASEASSAPIEVFVNDPDAPVVQASAKAADPDKSDTIVCRRERQTGSQMTVRVCRTRAEIDARAAKDQETLRNSRATQSEANCALSNSC
jgi:hypothetical protein